MIRSRSQFRIWSLLGKALPGGVSGTWAFIGCVSTEERSSKAVLTARKLVAMSDYLVFRFRDDPHSRFYGECERRTSENQQNLIAEGLPVGCISAHDLLDGFDTAVDDIERALEETRADHLLIDITSMPKRVFFFLIKRALQTQERFMNILVTYAEPEKYSDLALAENPLRWNTLPGFDAPIEKPDDRRVVISVGYEPLGLPDLVLQGEFRGARTHLLFPFPSLPERIKRNWEFAKQLYPQSQTDIAFKHVDSLNVPEVHDLLCHIGDQGQTQMTLAPYGPKPIALAMAFYASRYSDGPNRTSVYYTQPTSYNPDYSSGLKTRDGHEAINCYAIKRLGSFLY